MIIGFIFSYRELEFQTYIDNHMSKIHNQLVDHKKLSMT
jgi:hypothetical protein